MYWVCTVSILSTSHGPIHYLHNNPTKTDISILLMEKLRHRASVITCLRLRNWYVAVSGCKKAESRAITLVTLLLCLHLLSSKRWSWLGKDPGKRWQAANFTFSCHLVQMFCHCQSISPYCRHVGNKYKHIIKFLLTNYGILKNHIAEISHINHDSFLVSESHLLAEIINHMIRTMNNTTYWMEFLPV